MRLAVSADRLQPAPMAAAATAERDSGQRGWRKWARCSGAVLGAWVAVVMWFGADAGWRERMAVPALVAAGVLGLPVLAQVLRGVRGVTWLWAGLAVAGVASLWGGVTGVAGSGEALATGVVWILGVTGLGAMVAAGVWKGGAWLPAGLAWLFGLLVAASLAGYLTGAERWMLTEWTGWGVLDRRLAVIWPCRWWAAGGQRIWWEHPNIGAWFFACGMGLSLEAAWRRRAAGLRAAWPLLLLAAADTCALFLTASRAGLVLALAILPLVLAGRGWKWSGTVAATVAAGLLGGWILLENKVPPVTKAAPPSAVPPVAPPKSAAPAVAPVPPPAKPPPDLHVGGLVKRRDAGRLDGYRLWAQEEMPGHWWFGRGVSATGKPLPGGLPHEHSMWVATVRGGGLLALGGQLILLGLAGLAALRVARVAGRGCLVLWLAVVVGFLFDRSTVFRTTGTLEFFAHWTAVWLPFVILGTWERRAKVGAESGTS